jgi:energy-converting hydrogenase Eha subunit E
MDWGRAVDLYCERTDPSFWAEPINAITNAAFLIAALVAFVQWRRAGNNDWPVLVLIAVTFAIGLGSFTFHTVATSGAAKFDTIPIAVFIFGYLLLALRRFIGLSLIVSLGLLVAFAVFTYVEGQVVPRGTLNGSHAYLPALGALLAVAWPMRRQPAGRWLFAAAGTLAVSLTFRSIDMAVCDALPLGTHFLWHSLNGLALYLLLRAAMIARKSA